MSLSIFLMKVLRRIINPIYEWYISESVRSGMKCCGKNTRISGSIVLWCDNVTCGDKCYIYPGVVLWGPGEILIGNNVDLGFYSLIYASEKVQLGNNVLIAAHCYIIDSNHSIAKDALIREQKASVKGEIIIEDDVWLGAGVKVLSGVRIGRGAVIGAQSLVNKDIPPYAIAVGVPAKVIGYRK